MSSIFLESVLPSQGTYCVVSIQGGVVKQTFVQSHEEVESIGQGIDDAGSNAYFALASFSNKSRKAESASYLRSIFIDIDCGPGKPYAEVFDAAQALRAFIDTVGLPTPIVVNSGGGVHAYWPFTDDIPVADWLPAARAFKALCVQHKLGIDLAVTADSARILRLPGTHNRKTSTPRPVQIAALGEGPTAFSDFLKLLPATANSAPSANLAGAKSFGLDEATKSLAGKAPDAKFSQIARLSLKDAGCAQMKHALLNSATLEEPLWRGVLSVAWNCVDGEKAIHKVSKDHPDYTPESTLEKAQRLTDKPYTCAWYKNNNPTTCDKCPHKITSPIQLGTFVEEAKPNDDGLYVVNTTIKPDNEGDQPIVEVGIPEYPYPYFRGKTGGVYRKVKDEDGNELPPFCVYEQDLYVTGRFFDSDEHGDGEGEVVGINLHLPHDGVRRFHATVTSLMAIDKLRDTLVKHGVVAYGKHLNEIMAYLASSIRALQSRTASSRTRSQMGWTTEGTFVVGELEYTPSDIKLAPPASGTRQLAPLFYSKGSLEEWKKVIDFYGHPGMEDHAFAFLVGAGSPLLQLLNSTQVRGAVLNLVSNSSGTGKTTVQMAINSLFGHPSELLMEAKDTPASRFHRLGTLNSICMTVDELTNASGEQLSALVYGSTSGRASHRMEAQTNKLRNNNTKWCSITVTSSNAVMSDALASHRAAVEGELKRVIDLHIAVPPDIPKHLTDSLFTKLADNFGVAGPIYIQHVVANAEAISEKLKAVQLKTDEEAGMTRSDRFYSAVMAVAFTAGLILKELGLLDWDLSRIYKHAVHKVASVKDNNSATTGDQNSLATETLAAYINANVNNALVVNGAEGSAATAHPKGPLRLRYEPDTGNIIVPAADLRAFYVERRVDFKASMSAMCAQGSLKSPSRSRDFSEMFKIAAGAIGGMNAPAIRCYVFSGTSLGIKFSQPDESRPTT